MSSHLLPPLSNFPSPTTSKGSFSVPTSPTCTPPPEPPPRDTPPPTPGSPSTRCQTPNMSPLNTHKTFKPDRIPGLQITNPQSALLSNHEVLLHLQAQEAEYTGTDGTGRKREKPAGLKDALKDTLTYLTTYDRNCALSSPTERHTSRPMTLYKGPHSLFRALAPHYRLNKAEFLQLYNLRPTTEVELQVVLEEHHARFTDAQLTHMLALIGKVFEEEESAIPEGVEELHMEKVANKLEGAGAKRGKRRPA